MTKQIPQSNNQDNQNNQDQELMLEINKIGKIDYDLKPIDKAHVWKGVLEENTMWAYPKMNSYKEKMRELYKDYSRFKSQAKKLSPWVKELYSNFGELCMPVKTIPFPVDVERFSPNSNEKTLDCFVYFKGRERKFLNYIQNYLEDKKTKLILYTYDAFLFDYNLEDGLILEEIMDLLQYPVSIKQGKSYHGLTKI